MAARPFPNVVFVHGFAGQTSRYDLMRGFGGRKGHIEEVQFVCTPHEPKKAFIIYSDPSSVPMALGMNGAHLYGHHEELVVKMVDETILCSEVPEEKSDTQTALYRLQGVLCSVLDEKDAERSSHRTEVDRLNGLTKQAEAATVNLQNAVRKYTEDKGSVERNLTLQLTHARATLETVESSYSQAQAESGVLRTRLTEVEAQLKTTRELNESMAGETQVLRRLLQEASMQNERTSERLRKADNTIIRLDDELKLAKDARVEAQSSLRRLKSTLDDTNALARDAECYAAEARTKRRRAEEWLADEREAKRRLAEDVEKSGARCRASIKQVERGIREREEVEGRLRAEVAGRKEAEEQLAQAKAKLDRVVVTDALLAAFLKMERWTIRMVEEERAALAAPAH